MNSALIIVQLIVNLIFGLFITPVSKRFKIAALILFPFLAGLLPIIQLVRAITETAGAPDAIAFSEGYGIWWLLQVFVSIAVQLFFNRWGLRFLSNLRK